jgi:hypothetical protein
MRHAALRLRPSPYTTVNMNAAPHLALQNPTGLRLTTTLCHGAMHGPEFTLGRLASANAPDVGPIQARQRQLADDNPEEPFLQASATCFPQCFASYCPVSHC